MILTDMEIQQEARDFSMHIWHVQEDITDSTRASDSVGDEGDAMGLWEQGH